MDTDGAIDAPSEKSGFRGLFLRWLRGGGPTHLAKVWSWRGPPRRTSTDCRDLMLAMRWREP
jgi:hypothetical protein